MIIYNQLLYNINHPLKKKIIKQNKIKHKQKIKKINFIIILPIQYGGNQNQNRIINPRPKINVGGLHGRYIHGPFQFKAKIRLRYDRQGVT